MKKLYCKTKPDHWAIIKTDVNSEGFLIHITFDLSTSEFKARSGSSYIDKNFMVTHFPNCIDRDILEDTLTFPNSYLNNMIDSLVAFMDCNDMDIEKV